MVTFSFVLIIFTDEFLSCDSWQRWVDNQSLLSYVRERKSKKWEKDYKLIKHEIWVWKMRVLKFCRVVFNFLFNLQFSLCDLSWNVSLILYYGAVPVFEIKIGQRVQIRLLLTLRLLESNYQLVLFCNSDLEKRTFNWIKYICI